MNSSFEFLTKDYFLLQNFLYLFLVFSVITFLRYIVLSKIYITHVYDKIASLQPQRILSKICPTDQRNKEILWSGISSFIFGIIGVVMIMMWQYGYTNIYSQWSDYPLWYIPVSAIVAFLIHETYYYWLHRWLHHPKIYRYIHKIHHDSIDTSVWTSFSFHPIESILQALIIPLIAILIPLHIYVLMVLLVIMTISAIINHAGVEIFPSYAHQHPIWKQFIGATHHDLHHRRFVYNYGLYFTFWDRWMDTEVEQYDQIFEQIAQKKGDT